MTNRTDHGMRVSADIPRKGRQVALAASVALFAVTGTATIAWSALTIAFGPEDRLAVALSAPEAAPEAGAREFADQTRLQSAATRDRAPEARPAPVVLAQAATSASPAHRGAAALEAAVQPKPFSSARPASAPTPEPRPVARPAPAPRDTPTATPDTGMEAVVASAPPVATRPAPDPVPEPARTVARSEESASDRGSLLHRLWSVGMYR